MEFARHIAATLEHADGVARCKLGRSARLVVLLHADALVADRLAELLDVLSARHVQFISLGEALADPVYALPDVYIAPKGLSWLYRIAPLDARARCTRRRVG